MIEVVGVGFLLFHEMSDEISKHEGAIPRYTHTTSALCLRTVAYSSSEPKWPKSLIALDN